MADKGEKAGFPIAECHEKRWKEPLGKDRFWQKRRCHYNNRIRCVRSDDNALSPEGNTQSIDDNALSMDDNAQSLDDNALSMDDNALSMDAMLFFSSELLADG